jgi:hypothetical protein
MISVRKFTVNPFQENSYVVYDETGSCLIVDAGFFSRTERKELLGFLDSLKLKPEALVNTHCHFDHLMGVEFLREEFSIPFACHALDAFWLPLASEQSRSFGIEMPEVRNADLFFAEDSVFRFGNSGLKAIHRVMWFSMLPKIISSWPGTCFFTTASEGSIFLGEITPSLSNPLRKSLWCFRLKRWFGADTAKKPVSDLKNLTILT